MARNDDMDALSALLGLGILGAMADGATPFKGINPNGAERQSQKKPMTDDELLKHGAQAAWKLYESYTAVGFDREQAFELLLVVLGNKQQ